MIIFLLLFILILILILFIIGNNKEVVVNENKVINKDNVFFNNSYIKCGDEENLKDEIAGYENELMYENKFKEGDYVNQFDITNFMIKDDNQIGFNPIPREQMKQLPYANINFKCL